MAVITALHQTPSALRRNPILFVPVLVFGVLQAPQLILQSVNPLLASLVSMVLSLVYLVVVPFFQAGLLGLADEALDGTTSIDTFVQQGKSNYISVLVAYLLLVAINFVLGFVGLLVVVFGGVLVVAEGGSLSLLSLLVLALVGGVLLLCYLVFVFFIQFYGQAIVIDDDSAIDGIRRSMGLVKRHAVSVLGYSLLVGLVGGISGLFLGAVSILASPQNTELLALPQPSLPVIVGSVVLVVLGTTILGAVLVTYSVAFYRQLRSSGTD